MKARVKEFWDRRVYPCADCPYRDRDMPFCGFCLRKIMDELRQSDTGKQSPIMIAERQNETKSAHQIPDGQALSGFSHTFNRWDGYYLDDLDCRFCLHYSNSRRGCLLPSCCCVSEALDALAHGRFHRNPGS